MSTTVCRGQAGTSGTVVRDPVCGMTVDPEAGKPRPIMGPHLPFLQRVLPGQIPEGSGGFLQATDPVCGMSVDRATARHFLRHEGRDSISARRAASEVRGRPRSLSQAPGRRPRLCRRARNTPARCIREIVRDRPGSCPNCGMALEPMGVPTGDEGPNPELVDFTRRLVGERRALRSAARAHHGADVGLPLREWIGEPPAVWIELALATPVVLWAAVPFFHRGCGVDRQSQPEHVDADFDRRRRGLCLQRRRDAVPRIFPHRSAAMAARCRSISRRRPSSSRSSSSARCWSCKARERTGSAIRALLDLAPKTARRIDDDGSEADVPLDEVQAGDRLRVRPGDSVPVDGTVSKAGPRSTNR